MRKIACSVTRAAALAACMMIGALSACAWAAPTITISDSGKGLASVFEGLKPNPQVANYQPVLPLWRGNLPSRLPGLRNANIIYGNYCPATSCEGNYATIVGSGGCMSTGCNSVTNFITDTEGGDCRIGARNVECGGGDLGPCCANWDECEATNTIGCPKN